MCEIIATVKQIESARQVGFIGENGERLEPLPLGNVEVEISNNQNPDKYHWVGKYAVKLEMWDRDGGDLVIGYFDAEELVQAIEACCPSVRRRNEED